MLMQNNFKGKKISTLSRTKYWQLEQGTYVAAALPPCQWPALANGWARQDTQTITLRMETKSPMERGGWELIAEIWQLQAHFCTPRSSLPLEWSRVQDAQGSGNLGCLINGFRRKAKSKPKNQVCIGKKFSLILKWLATVPEDRDTIRIMGQECVCVPLCM